jgi:hypothetical protein
MMQIRQHSRRESLQASGYVIDEDVSVCEYCYLCSKVIETCWNLRSSERMYWIKVLEMLVNDQSS